MPAWQFRVHLRAVSEDRDRAVLALTPGRSTGLQPGVVLADHAMSGTQEGRISFGWLAALLAMSLERALSGIYSC